jgi:hypothetical protein
MASGEPLAQFRVYSSQRKVARGMDRAKAKPIMAAGREPRGFSSPSSRPAGPWALTRWSGGDDASAGAPRRRAYYLIAIFRIGSLKSGPTRTWLRRSPPS